MSGFGREAEGMAYSRSVFTREEFRERVWLKSHSDLVKSGLTRREAYIEANRLEESRGSNLVLSAARENLKDSVQGW